MKKCRRCNKEFEEQFVFCSNCGQQLVNESIEAEPISSETQKRIDFSFEQSSGSIINVTDPTIFASQFPQWDLQPPTVVVRRIRRVI